VGRLHGLLELQGSWTDGTLETDRLERMNSLIDWTPRKKGHLESLDCRRYEPPGVTLDSWRAWTPKETGLPM
jgi:hypothetical protein